MSDAPMQEGHPVPGAPPADPAVAAGPPTEWVRRPVGDFDPRYKSPRSAVFLSLIFPGLGQIYTGFYVRGLMIAAVVFGIFLTLGNINEEEVAIVLVWTTMFIWMFSMIDAGRMAALYNYATSGGEEIEMPQDVKIPQLGGSIVIGIVFIAFGGIALSNTLFNYPLEWIEDWWPIFPLAVGAYLLIRGILDHLNQQGGGSLSGKEYSADEDFSSGAIEQE